MKLAKRSYSSKSSAGALSPGRKAMAFGDATEVLTIEQLLEHTAESAWFNEKQTDQEDIEIARELLRRQGPRPLTLAQRIEMTDGLDVIELFAQMKQEPLSPKGLLMHRMERGSVPWLSLFAWAKYDDMIKPFIRPIHLRIDEAERGVASQHIHITLSAPNNKRSADQRESEVKDTGADLYIQNRLIATRVIKGGSHLLIGDAMTRIEQALAAYVIRLYLWRSMLLMFIGWTEETPYALVIAFDLRGDSYPLSETVVQMTRADIFGMYDEIVPCDTQVIQTAPWVLDTQNAARDKPLLDTLRAVQKTALVYRNAAMVKL
jgi:hypothetical protein